MLGINIIGKSIGLATPTNRHVEKYMRAIVRAVGRTVLYFLLPRERPPHMKIRIGTDLNELYGFKNDPKVTALEAWISLSEWHLWVTFTFRRVTFLPTAIRHLKRFIKYHLPEAKDNISKRIKAFVVYEGQDARKGVHIHLLINGIKPEVCSMIQDKWYRMFGKAEVEPYDKNLNGSWYLARKYIKQSFICLDKLTIHRRY